MEFYSIPKPLPPDDIDLKSAEQFINDFDSFAKQEDAKKKLPSVRKTGEAARFLFSPEQCQEFLPKLVDIIHNEDTTGVKVVAIEQLVYFIEKMSLHGMDVYTTLYEPMKELVVDETEEIAQAARDVMKKISETLTSGEQIEEYLNYVDELIANIDGFISVTGLDLLIYFAAKSSPTNVKDHIFSRLRTMSQSIQFIRRKGAVTVFPAILSNVEKGDIPEVLSIFETLSRDSVYSVRKTCVVVLAKILDAFTEDRERVAVYVRQFIKDQSRYVRYQVIANFGRFIQFIGKENIDDEIIQFFITNCSADADCEQQYYAAYYFVTLLQTLGSDKWPVLAQAFSQLALSIHWKNRKCIASSLHVLARILGNDVTMSYLIPALDKYLCDYEEIKQIAMMHVVDFIPVLGQEKSVTIITLLQNSVQSADWRIRESVANQLGLLAETTPLYAVYVEEICIALLLDNVTRVRNAAALQMGSVVAAFIKNGYTGVTTLVQKLTDMMNSPLKTQHVDFVTIAGALFRQLKADEFKSFVLPALVTAAHDKVSSVRATVAKVIKTVMEGHENYTDELKAIAEELAKDEDDDVKYIMGHGPIEIFVTREPEKSVVEDPCRRIVSFEGFGRK